jgi:hypothetical protein
MQRAYAIYGDTGTGMKEEQLVRVFSQLRWRAVQPLHNLVELVTDNYQTHS